MAKSAKPMSPRLRKKYLRIDCLIALPQQKSPAFGRALILQLETTPLQVFGRASRSREIESPMVTAKSGKAAPSTMAARALVQLLVSGRITVADVEAAAAAALD